MHALLQVFPDADVGEVSARGPITIIDLSRGGIAAQLVCAPRWPPALMRACTSALQLQLAVVWPRTSTCTSTARPWSACLGVQVGLCMVDREALPAEWSVRPELLPPMGASPDAMLHHRPVTPASALVLSTSAAASVAGPAAGGAAQGSVAAAAVPPSAAVGASTAGQRVPDSRYVSRGFHQPASWAAAPGSAPGVRTSAALAPALPATIAAGCVNSPAPGRQPPPPAGLPTERGLRLCSDLESEMRASKVTLQPQPRQAMQPAGQPTTLAADIEALLQRLQLSTQQKQRPGAVELASAPVAEAPGPESAPATRGNGSAPAQRHLQPPPQAAGAPHVLGAEEAGGRLEMVEVKNT